MAPVLKLRVPPVFWMLPDAVPTVVIPAVDPIMSPPPDAKVKFPAPVRVLVPMLSVAPEFTVKSKAPVIVPPEVKIWVPAFWNTTEVDRLPVSVRVPPVIEQSPLRLIAVVVLLTSVVFSVPPVSVKFPVTFMVTVAPPLANAKVPALWL